MRRLARASGGEAQALGTTISKGQLREGRQGRVAGQGRDSDPILSLLAAAAAKSPQLCPTLCDPIDGSPPGSPVPGSLQARTLEWVAISFSNA